jgi:DNA adenine methylase
MEEKNKSTKPTKPLLKWVGGKTQLLDTLLPLFPTEIQNYYELFIGGGSILLALLSETPRRIQGQIYAYDTNPVLISFYQHLQAQPQALHDILQEIIQEFQSITSTPLTGDKPIRKPQTLEEAKTSRESYYYWIRQQYNHLTAEQQQRAYGVALFFFLNKTCFRGVFRVGPNGFNVPYGHYVNPEIVNYEHWMEIHRLIQPVNFMGMDCSISMTLPQPGDFVYLDPPYVQETKTSFVGYSLEGFSLEKSRLLFYQCHQWIERGVSWVMSNSDTPLLNETFPETPEKKYHLQQVTCRRAINSKHPETIANEVIVSHISTLLQKQNQAQEES